MAEGVEQNWGRFSDIDPERAGFAFEIVRSLARIEHVQKVLVVPAWPGAVKEHIIFVFSNNTWGLSGMLSFDASGDIQNAYDAICSNRETMGLLPLVTMSEEDFFDRMGHFGEGETRAIVLWNR